MELVQGEGGVHPADVQWVKTLYAYCKEADILFMVDEIQTGIGRTGSLFAYEQYEIEPDAITLAKGLGSGFPIGALLAKKQSGREFFSRNAWQYLWRKSFGSNSRAGYIGANYRY